ncbi:M1 family metallopeptidase [Sediminibacterium sp.]|uniref:M1 family metallopeptidase n=1 Tax=Sediminibacterium sp. TaxID=1917865 RepID=UPI00273701BB|nr:M1 family metallopeptidase [Sediminibacterium sp.]MDP3392986.1 M1 family metallopeptidase [Sediminibacterium sp.]MDP3567192.1 M1 family metallopeptidase [Sediminibacterium sp.]
MKYLYALLFLLAPLFSWADYYPINKHIDVKHYSFEISLSDSTNEIIGTTKIRVLFKKSGIQQFRLDLVNQTDKRQGKGMKVESIMMGSEKLTFTHVNDELLLHLPSPTAVDAELVFSIQYHGVPFDGLRIGATKFGDRSFFNENWPNRTRHWLPTIDHPYDKATSEFIVKAPAKYKVVSNGLLLEESYLGNNVKLTHWKQSVPVSSWLFVLGVAEFAVQYVDQFNGKSIETWVYAKNREAGFYDFKEPTKKVLEFYSEYVGPFAYEKLANIQTPSVNGGMETSSAIFYGEDLVNGKRDERTRNIVIHEIAHQWFGNAVTETTWDDAWLSEGFATYFTLLFIESEYGKAEFDKGIQKAKKAVFDMSAKMPNFSIISNRTAEKEVVTTGLTYQKGAWILHMLRNLVGDANFQKGIQLYYAKYFNANANTDEFREEMERASGKDLKPFFKQWLYQPINPIINASWSFDTKQKKLILKLEQVQNSDMLFDLPVEINYYTKGNASPKTIKVQLNKKEQLFSFPSNSAPEKIVLDPNNILLSVVNYVN